MTPFSALKRLVATTALVSALCHPALAQQTIKIGSVLSVTGPASFLGEPEDKTLRMYVDKINAAGGVDGKKIELVLYDDGGDANKARTFATRLIEDDKVVAMVGGSTTGTTMAMIPVFEAAEVPLISLGGAIEIVDPVQQIRVQDAAHRQDGVRKDLREPEAAQPDQHRDDLRHRRLRRLDARAMQYRRAEIRHQGRHRGDLRSARQRHDARSSPRSRTPRASRPWSIRASARAPRS